LRWAPLLVVAAAWLAHAGARDATWVLDDVRLVRDNALVARGPSAIPHIFARHDGDDLSATIARHGPLTVASFALEAPLWKRSDGTLAPTGFHLTNLLLHGLCVLLLLRVLLGLLPGRPLWALSAAMLFAVHPLGAGTVTSLMGRAQILATLFSLLAVLAWRAWAGRHAAWLPIAALAWLLALEASPLALGVPLVLWLLDVAAPRAPAQEGARAPLARFALLVFAVPLAIYLTTAAVPGSLALDLPAQPWFDRLAIGFLGLPRLLLAVLLPVALRGDHTDEAVPGVGFELGAPWAWGLVALCVVLAVLALLRARRGDAGVLSASWLALLALAVPAFAGLPAGAPLETAFGYLVALPLFAACGLLGEALFATPRAGVTPGFARMRGALLGALAVICLVGLTQREALGWRDDEAFHERLLDRNPQHVRAMVRLARAQRESAARLRASAAVLPAESPERKADLRLRREALERSMAWARQAVTHELGRHNAAAWRELGFSQLAMDKTADALHALEQARDLDPSLAGPVADLLRDGPAVKVRSAAETWFAIGRCREALGERHTAADAFLRASRLDEDDVGYLRKAGTSLCRDNRYAAGLRLLIEARRRTADPKAGAELDATILAARRSAREIAARLLAEGEAAQARGDMREAGKLYDRAVGVNPASVKAWIRLAWLRGMWFGNYQRAEACFRRAEVLLEKGGAAKSDPDWRHLRDLRRELAKQKAEEEDDGG